MGNNKIHGTRTSLRAVVFFKWLLFGAELFLLWVLCNTLFLVPGPYFGFRGGIIAASTILSGSLAWASGRLFLVGSTREPASARRVIASPPAVICILVLSAASIVMIIAVSVHR